MADRALLEESGVGSGHSWDFRQRRGRNWFFLGLLYAGYYLCRYNLGIVSPELCDEFKLDKSQFGWISTSRDGGYAIGQFVNGLFTDGLGGKQAMAVGALGTILLNFIFGWTSTTGIAWMLLAFVIIRFFDGYFQAFGAPGMVKINTSWFQRRERGRFAGIFGGMIQLGVIGVGKLGKVLILGFTIPFVGYAVGGLHWRYMFYVPPAVLLFLVVLMWVNVKNHPEEAGYRVAHDDDVHAAEYDRKLPLGYVFRTIASNWLSWVNASAYFCTGFVRRSIEVWWTLYLVQAWSAGKESNAYMFLVWALPISAFIGSFSSGILSDTLFRGRRAPVAALLYGLETCVILGSIYVLGMGHGGSLPLACACLTLVSLTCNSSHSIIGTAVAMDLGGRKMAGFALGVIDSFQYFGAMLAGWKLGGWIDAYGWSALFISMVPFSALGTTLMVIVWWRTRGRDVHGS